MSDTATTGPELYKLGVEWLKKAEERWIITQLPQANDTALAAAAIAQAAFAGAHAAALGTLAADESDSDELSAAWCAAVGDVETSQQA